ncbi:MAG: type III-A CRISPR-associated RAMP protein Csm3 [Thermodesulfobacteriota bacterium]
MKLTSIKQIRGTIELISGLHIGAGDSEMRIGGTDKPVVINPHTGEPYIPGSSLKGKIRSLLEMRSGLIDPREGKPLGTSSLKNVTDDKKKEGLKILRLFGISGAEGDAAREVGPTRASFADCPLNEASRIMLESGNFAATEIKAETAIDRIQGTAQGKSLRFTERVVAGLCFDFAITLKELEDGDGVLEVFLLEGMKMLEYDALGGSGSRGYGRIKFHFADDDRQKKFAEILPLA